MGRIRGRWKLTGSPLSSRVGQWDARSLVKQIQRGTITIANGASTNTAALSPAVDVSTSRIRFLGCSTNDGTSSMGRIALTNGTTVTATRAGANNSTLVSYEVTEYWPGVLKQVQRGTIALPAATASATATITTSTALASEVDYLGSTVADAGAPTNQENNNRLTLTNATTVTAARSSSSFDAVVGFQVTEFYQ